MIEFQQELKKLLDLETKPLAGDSLVEAALAGKQTLASLNKKQSDIALQVEEIYDLVEGFETNALQEALQSEKKRADALADATVAMSDILEDFCAYAAQSGDEELERQARIMWNNSGSLLERSGFVRLGREGQTLDPSIHTVQAAEYSDYPKEQVARVLQSGYRYRGNMVRRAAVLISSGKRPATIEPAIEEPETELPLAELPLSERFRFSVTLHFLRRKPEKPETEKPSKNRKKKGKARE